MNIVYGLRDGMVMQRNERQECDVHIRIDTEGAPLKTDLGVLTPCGNEREYRLTGIPVGGPYTITLSREGESSAQTFTNLYVGDVWIAAGQSNMEGCGIYTEEDRRIPTDETIRACYLDDCWKPAAPQLHHLWKSKDAFFANCHFTEPEEFNTGVGPGYFFLADMRLRTGVPQGIIPCAFGGTSLAQWSPDHKPLGGGSLYGAMLRRFQLCGSHVRGVFWHQGCAETSPEGARLYKAAMKKLIASMREDMGDPTLPFVQVQLHKYTVNMSGENDRCWNQIREQQRTLGCDIPYMDTVASVDCSLDDGIHLDSPSQRKVGRRAAESMFHLCYDPSGSSSLPAPALLSVTAEKDWRLGMNIIVKFKNLHEGLRSEGLPSGFALTSSDTIIDSRNIYKTELCGDCAVLKTEYSAAQIKQLYLYYGFGNTYFCNVTDGAGRSLPAFGPVRIIPEEN